MFCTKCGKQLPNGSTFCSGCGKKLAVSGATLNTSVNKGVENAAEGAIYSIEGVRGKHIDIYENKCVIKTKITIGSLLMHNATDGEKTIYYKDCIGIQFKKAGITIGYLQLETSVAMMNNLNSNFSSENSFTFDVNVVSNEKMQEVADYVKRRIDEIKTGSVNSATVIQASSAADELKKFKELLDMGVITQAEFDSKKKQLLGL